MQVDMAYRHILADILKLHSADIQSLIISSSKPMSDYGTLNGSMTLPPSAARLRNLKIHCFFFQVLICITEL